MASDPVLSRPERLLSTLKGLMARSEQDRSFGPAKCRQACLDAIAQALQEDEPRCTCAASRVLHENTCRRFVAARVREGA
jgi:hypothetical protein